MTVGSIIERRVRRLCPVVRRLRAVGVLVVVVGSAAGCSSSAPSRSDPSACGITKRTTIAALESYFARNNRYPSGLAVLKTDGFVADFPNLEGDTLNGPTVKDGARQWTIAYRAASDGTSFELTVPVQPPDGC